MSEKRLNNILSIEHDLCQKLDLEVVVTEFAKSNRRIASIIAILSQPILILVT